MKILIIDNYDSFTYNLVRYVKELSKGEVSIFRNDEIKLEKVNEYDKILLSPGPGLPKDAGIMNNLIVNYSKTKSILGVCLGCQAIAESYGGKLEQLETQYHGVTDKIYLLDNSEILYKGIDSPIEVGRYHSWIVSKENLPQDLIITSEDSLHNIMSIRHCTDDVRGVQFHPESIMTPMGRSMIENWLNQ